MLVKNSQTSFEICWLSFQKTCKEMCINTITHSFLFAMVPNASSMEFGLVEESSLSDESRFLLHVTYGRMRVWWQPNTAYAERNIVGTVPFGGVSDMVWGCVSVNNTTDGRVVMTNTMDNLPQWHTCFSHANDLPSHCIWKLWRTHSASRTKELELPVQAMCRKWYVAKVVIS
jgi:hypothetical protein